MSPINQIESGEQEEWKVINNNLEDIQKKISPATSFDELFLIIGKIGTIITRKGVMYTPEMLKLLINNIRDGEKTLDDLTTNAGFRETVERLLKSN